MQESLFGGQHDAVDDVLLASHRRFGFHHHHVVTDAAAGDRGAAATLVRGLHAARVMPERRVGKRRGLLRLRLLVGAVIAGVLLVLLRALRFDGRGHGARHQYQSDDE